MFKVLCLLVVLVSVAEASYSRKGLIAFSRGCQTCCRNWYPKAQQGGCKCWCREKLTGCARKHDMAPCTSATTDEAGNEYGNCGTV